MLVLTRKMGEQIRINRDIVITVVKILHDKVRLGIVAPADVAIARGELVGESGDMETFEVRQRRLANHGKGSVR